MISTAKKFDKCLRNLFTVSGTRCEDLAGHLGVAVPVVRRWANGASAPDVYQFKEIADFFGVPYGWFLGPDDGGPTAEQMAVRLGLREEVVEDMMVLAETEADEVLTALDEAVSAAVDLIMTVREDQ